MPGNAGRRGAVRKTPKGAAPSGSGGQRRKGLEGKGPTPKASDREYHPAHRRTAGRAGAGSVSRGGSGSTGRAGSAGREGSGSADREGTRSRRPGTGGQRTGPRRSPTGARRTTAETVAGRNAVVEALRAGIPATALHLAGRVDDDRVREAVKYAAARGIPVLETMRADLDRLTDGAVHQGVALQVPPYEYATLSEVLRDDAPAPPLVVALDGVTDPRNLGAVIRSVAAFGGSGVVVPERRAVPLTAGAWKASAGAAARVRVSRVTNLTRALQQAQAAGFTVVGLDGRAPQPVADLPDATDPLVLVLGSEDKGLSRLVRETCDVVVTVPIVAAVESLNAGVAAGIALYEIDRLRGAARPGRAPTV